MSVRRSRAYSAPAEKFVPHVGECLSRCKKAIPRIIDGKGRACLRLAIPMKSLVAQLRVVAVASGTLALHFALLLLLAATTGGVSSANPIAQGDAATLFVTASQSSALQSENTGEADFEGRIVAIEQRTGARIGVAALDTGSGKRLDYRSEERFPMCSTFKFLAAAAVLKRVDDGQDKLDRFASYGAKDIQEYAPVTKAHLKDGGMTLG